MRRKSVPKTQTRRREIIHSAVADVPKEKSQLKDWANVWTSIGTLIIGVVSLWATLQISGLEDYFQSEISRRNSELDKLQISTEKAEMRSEKEREELDRIRTIVDEIFSDALDQQAKNQDMSQMLSETRAKVLESQRDLEGIRSESRKQARNLELFYRQQAAKLLWRVKGWSLRDMLSYGEIPTPRSEQRLGAEYKAALISLSAPNDQYELQPFIDRARVRMFTNCPEIFQIVVDVPEVPPEIPYPPYSTRAMTPLELEENRKERAKIIKSIDDRRNSISENQRKISRENFAFYGRVQDCVCEALAENGFSESAVCRERTDLMAS